MRKCKMFIISVLMLTLCLSSSLNALAASGYKSQWKSFLLIAEGTKSTNYAITVQQLVRDYNELTREFIDDNGGVDGKFGAATKSAVEIFQEEEKCTKWNGIVGEETWGKFSDNITKGTTIYVDNEGYFDAFKTSTNMNWHNYGIRRATVSGNWLVKTTSNGYSDPGIGTYVTFNWQ